MAMYAKVRRIRLREGFSVSEIARRTILSRNTIKGWLRAPARSEMQYRRAAGPAKVTPYVDVLRRALEADAQRLRRERRTARKLHARLQQQGFTRNVAQVQFAHTMLCASRAFSLVGYPSQGHEMLFDALTQCLNGLGGVAGRGIYDNMKTAVDQAPRKDSDRFVNARLRRRQPPSVAAAKQHSELNRSHAVLEG